MREYGDLGTVPLRVVNAKANLEDSARRPRGLLRVGLPRSVEVPVQDEVAGQKIIRSGVITKKIDTIGGTVGSRESESVGHSWGLQTPRSGQGVAGVVRKCLGLPATAALGVRPLLRESQGASNPATAGCASPRTRHAAKSKQFLGAPRPAWIVTKGERAPDARGRARRAMRTQRTELVCDCVRPPT